MEIGLRGAPIMFNVLSIARGLKSRLTAVAPALNTLRLILLHSVSPLILFHLLPGIYRDSHSSYVMLARRHASRDMGALSKFPQGKSYGKKAQKTK